MRATAAIGTLTKKIHCHGALSTISPPITGPSTGPSSIGTPMTDITRPMWRGPAVWASTLIPTGMIRPPPRPWSTRKQINDPSDLASPHSADPTANTATEIIHTRLEPKRWVNHPASGITIASDSR